MPLPVKVPCSRLYLFKRTYGMPCAPVEFIRFAMSGPANVLGSMATGLPSRALRSQRWMAGSCSK
jgi:hypothetical protein